MKRLLFALFLLMVLVSACGIAPGKTTLEPVQTDAPTIPSDTAPAETSVPILPSETDPAPTDAAPNAKLPAASFEAQPYINEAADFALDIPAGWTIDEQGIGPRGTHTCPGGRCQGIQFLSLPELADAATLPEGATRVNATIYQWEPKNDLAAFVAKQKTAWEASGFTILEEEQLVLELGLPAVRFTLQTPESQAIFLMAALEDQYLVLSGDGDLELVKEIVERVRPVSR